MRETLAENALAVEKKVFAHVKELKRRAARGTAEATRVMTTSVPDDGVKIEADPKLYPCSGYLIDIHESAWL